MQADPILLLAVGLTLAACHDTGGPLTSPSTVGILVVSTVSGGNEPDQDGYLLTVNGVDSLPLDPIGTSRIALPPGQHTLRLLGMAEHCSISPGTPLDVAVLSRDTTSVAFSVTCSATGVRITTTTTGLDFDTDGYRVEVDGTDRGAVPSNGSVFLRLEEGGQTIALTGMKTNCAVDGAVSRNVTIMASEITPIDFAAACTATSGVIGVIISGSGLGAVHEATVDGVTRLAVGPGDRSYLGAVTAGDHVVSLSPAATCSVDTDQQSVTVTAGSLVRDTVEVTFSVTCAAPPGRARLAFVRRPQPGPDGMPGRPDIYLANADGSGATRLTSGANPAWSPDGRRIAFYREGTIHVIDADGSREQPLQQGANPAWSPDGTRIVFTGFINSDDGIFVMNTHGSGLTLLIRGDFAHPGSRDQVHWPEWSPDGRISFVLTPEYDSFEPWQIYIMNADGSDPRNLDVLRSVGGGLAEVHNWSPDGSRIALGVNQAAWTIASVSSTGDDFRVHHRDQPDGVATHPDWSPDGRHIVFNRYATTASCEIPTCPVRIFVVSTEGGPARQLIPELSQAPAYWDHEPAWSRATE